jgi:TatD DNase family protein
MLVDSHCHLDRLEALSAAAALEAARARGVSRFLCVCINEANKAAVLDIARQHADVYASVGVHPCDVTDQVTAVESLCDWASADKVIALGETGLDYYHSQDAKTAQQQSFIHHLQAAKQLQLPVIVHTREAKADTLNLLDAHACRQQAGVMHCFTEDWAMAEAALALGFYISISGIVTFKNAQQVREVAQRVPLDRLLIETDSPYLAPIPYRGKPNQPAYVREVASCIADLRGITLDRLAAATTDNFLRLFSRAR